MNSSGIRQLAGICRATDSPNESYRTELVTPTQSSECGKTSRVSVARVRFSVEMGSENMQSYSSAAKHR